MLFVNFACIGILLMGGAPSSTQAVAVESGSFLLFLAGRQVGRESYTHQKNGSQDLWSGTVDIQTGDTVLKQTPKLVLTADGRPVSFDLEYSTGGTAQSLSYAFGENNFTVTSKGSGKDGTEEFPMPEGAVVLANNVLHHEIILTRRYDWKKGGRQEFVAVPSTPVALDSRGTDEFVLNGRPITLRHLFLSIGGVIGANLWLDPQDRIIKVDLPLQRIAVFLEGYEKIEPVPTGTTAAKPAWEAVEASFSSENTILSGTLTFPRTGAGRFPAVVLISDTGPQNRDGDSPGIGGLKLGIFRKIAETLSSNGIAVLRYDDRGVGKSSGNFPTADITDFERDARAAVSYLRSRREVDPGRIGIVGYTEGAMLGARIAADSPEIRALVSLACPARNGEEIMRWQQERSLDRLGLREEDHKSEENKGQAFIDAIKKADEDVIEIEDQKVNVRWFREFFAVDPLSVMKKVKCPVAIIQGGKDVQVPPEDAQALDKALTESDNRDHQLKVYPELGHLFTESSGDGMAEIADTRKAISEEALDFILGFLKRKL